LQSELGLPAGYPGLMLILELRNAALRSQQLLKSPTDLCWVVLAMCRGNTPAVRVWTANAVWFSSRPVQKPGLLTLGRPNPYLSTDGFRRVWLDLSVAFSGSAFRVSHSRSHSAMQLLIVKDCRWYITVYSWHIGRPNVQNELTHLPYHILKMSVNWVSSIFGLASSVIWVAVDLKHP